MAFAAMANGVEDDAEAELWQSRTQDLLRSMGEYVRSGGRVSSRPATTTPAPAAAAAAATGAAAAAVQLHSFPMGQSRSAPQSRASAAGVAGEGGPKGEGGDGSPPDNLWVAEHVGLPLCEAMVAYRGVSEPRQPVHRLRLRSFRPSTPSKRNSRVLRPASCRRTSCGGPSGLSPPCLCLALHAASFVCDVLEKTTAIMT